MPIVNKKFYAVGALALATGANAYCVVDPGTTLGTFTNAALTSGAKFGEGLTVIDDIQGGGFVKLVHGSAEISCDTAGSKYAKSVIADSGNRDSGKIFWDLLNKKIDSAKYRLDCGYNYASLAVNANFPLNFGISGYINIHTGNVYHMTSTSVIGANLDDDAADPLGNGIWSATAGSTPEINPRFSCAADTDITGGTVDTDATNGFPGLATCTTTAHKMQLKKDGTVACHDNSNVDATFRCDNDATTVNGTWAAADANHYRVEKRDGSFYACKEMPDTPDFLLSRYIEGPAITDLALVKQNYEEASWKAILKAICGQWGAQVVTTSATNGGEIACRACPEHATCVDGEVVSCAASHPWMKTDGTTTLTSCNACPDNATCHPLASAVGKSHFTCNYGYVKDTANDNATACISATTSTSLVTFDNYSPAAAVKDAAATNVKTTGESTQKVSEHCKEFGGKISNRDIDTDGDATNTNAVSTQVCNACDYTRGYYQTHRWKVHDTNDPEKGEFRCDVNPLEATFDNVPTGKCEDTTEKTDVVDDNGQYHGTAFYRKLWKMEVANQSAKLNSATDADSNQHDPLNAAAGQFVCTNYAADEANDARAALLGCKSSSTSTDGKQRYYDGSDFIGCRTTYRPVTGHDSTGNHDKCLPGYTHGGDVDMDQTDGDALGQVAAVCQNIVLRDGLDKCTTYNAAKSHCSTGVCAAATPFMIEDADGVTCVTDMPDNTYYLTAAKRYKLKSGLTCTGDLKAAMGSEEECRACNGAWNSNSCDACDRGYFKNVDPATTECHACPTDAAANTAIVELFNAANPAGGADTRADLKTSLETNCGGYSMNASFTAVICSGTNVWKDDHNKCRQCPNTDEIYDEIAGCKCPNTHFRNNVTNACEEKTCTAATDLKNVTAAECVACNGAWDTASGNCDACFAGYFNAHTGAGTQCYECPTSTGANVDIDPLFANAGTEAEKNTINQNLTAVCSLYTYDYATAGTVGVVCTSETETYQTAAGICETCPVNERYASGVCDCPSSSHYKTAAGACVEKSCPQGTEFATFTTEEHCVACHGAWNTLDSSCDACAAGYWSNGAACYACPAALGTNAVVAAALPGEADPAIVANLKGCDGNFDLDASKAVICATKDSDGNDVVRDSNDVCVSCRANETRNGAECECKAENNFVLEGGECRPCPTNETVSGGQCMCNPLTHFKKDEACTPFSTITPEDDDDTTPVSRNCGSDGLNTEECYACGRKMKDGTDGGAPACQTFEEVSISFPVTLNVTMAEGYHETTQDESGAPTTEFTEMNNVSERVLSHHQDFFVKATKIDGQDWITQDSSANAASTAYVVSMNLQANMAILQGIPLQLADQQEAFKDLVNSFLDDNVESVESVKIDGQNLLDILSGFKPMVQGLIDNVDGSGEEPEDTGCATIQREKEECAANLTAATSGFPNKKNGDPITQTDLTKLENKEKKCQTDLAAAQNENGDENGDENGANCPNNAIVAAPMAMTALVTFMAALLF